jgi:cell division septation protein DedD
MVKYCFREKNDPAHAAGSRGSIRQAILLVLLLLTAGLGYLYFFTGLIKPREHIEIAPPPAAAPVKQPLPPRLTQEAIEEASTAAKEEERLSVPGKEEKAAATPPPAGDAKETAEPAAPPAAKPAVKTKTKPSVVVSGKTAASSAPKPASLQMKTQSVKTAKTGEKPAAKAETKARTDSPPPATKPAKDSGAKPAAAGAVKEKRPEPAVTEGKYKLLIGGPAGSNDAEKMRTGLRKEGITDIEIRKIKKIETMHRIFLGEFESQAKANAEFNQLKTHADGAFVLRENGRYLLYAGSYLQEEKAKRELKRLTGKGLKPVLKSAKVSITVNEVMAGSFPGAGEARKEADRLKKKGIISKVIKTGQ